MACRKRGRLGLDPIQYTNDESHKWGAWIGVLYDTHIWKAGYSKEQNGEWKRNTNECKNNLLNIKYKLGMDSKL